MPVQPMPRLADGRVPHVTDGWRMRSNGRFHYGVDMLYPRKSSDKPVNRVTASPSGRWFLPYKVPALAVMPGKVLESKLITTGWYVYLDHENGWRSQYMHGRDGTALVSKGDRVSEGAPLFEVGGNIKTGREDLAHIHFQLRKDGNLIDPEPYVEHWGVAPNPWAVDPVWLLAAAMAAYVWLG